MILLDSNILLRYAKTTDPAYPVVDAAITHLHAVGEILVIVPQNIYEFWVVVTRPVANNGLGFTVIEAQTEVARLKNLCTFLPDQPGLFSEWESLVVTHDCKGKVAHDARLVATRKTHGISRLLTFNGNDFQRYPGLTILDPATVANPSSNSP
ncbi:MAG: PIN domain-containing protein [Gemmataceae bacterium]